MRIKLLTLLLISLLILSCKLSDFIGDDIYPDDIDCFEFVHNAPVYSNALSSHLTYPYLFVADGNARLTVFDIMVPWSFNSISTVDLQSQVYSHIYEMDRDSRNVLYAAMGTSGLYSFNTSFPYTVEIQSFKRDVYAKSVSIDEGNYFGDLLAVCGDNFWKVYEIIGSGQIFELSGVSSVNDRQYKKVHLKYPFLYLASTSALDIYDISNPSNPHLASTEILYDFKQFQFIGDRLIVMTNGNLYFYNISNPYSIGRIATYAFNLIPSTFYFQDGTLLVAYNNKKLSCYTISSQYNINHVSSTELNYFINDIKYYNEYYYLSCGNYGIANMKINMF